MAGNFDLNYTAPATVSRFMHSDAFFRIMHGPLGSGKTTGCLIELGRRCLQMPPGPGGLRKSRWAVIRNTRAQLKDTVLKSFFEWFPPGVFGTWKESEMVYHLNFNDVRAEILFRALDSPEDIQRVLSLELSGCFIEESRELDLEIVLALQGRIGRYPARKEVPEYWCGMICSTNPPEFDSVWYKIIEGLPLEENNPESVMECEAFKQPSGLSPEAENIDFLKPNYYEDLARGKTQSWVDTYIHGKYAPSMAGKPVYANSFKLDKHVSPVPLKIDPHLAVLVGFDTGLSPALRFSQIIDGRQRVLREIAAFDMGMKRCIQNYVRPLVRNCFSDNALIFVGDPAAVRRGDGDESSALKELKEAFCDDERNVFKVAATNDPDVRIQATEQMLVQFPEGEPMMLIDPSCKRYIRGLQSMYRYPRIRSSGGFSDRPQKTGEPGTFGHLVEAGHYVDMYILGGKYNAADYNKIYTDDNTWHFLNRRSGGHRPAQAEGY